MSELWYNIRGRFLCWLADAILADTGYASLSDEKRRGMMSMLYQNSAFRLYLDERERYLRDGCVESFLSGKRDNAAEVSGQLMELRRLRAATKSSHYVITEQRKQRKSSSDKNT